MGAIYEAGFSRALQNGGLTNLNDWRRGLTRDGSSDFAFDLTVTSASNANPYTQLSSAWNRTGSRLKEGDTWGIWTSDVPQTVGSLGIQLPGPSSSWVDFIVIDGNDLPQSIDTGTEVTLEVSSSQGTADFIRPGLAEIVLNGLSSFTAYYVLMSGGSPIGDSGSTVAEDTENGSSWNYNSSNTRFEAGGDVTFDNNSGSDWNVDAIEVRVGGESGDTAFKDTVSATVVDGGSITFTDITQSINGLT